ncbi:hypothetical protein [uncultured Paracoccus sp.]|uniref:hypothetical protein n=1 Tax=uncultured Paracoccus sp. TaxID=189685 RepID=UPI00260B1C8F|nr:hypothetical protein [uncultured Paracoccus sp.]
MTLRQRIGAALGSDEAVTIGAILTAIWLVLTGAFWLFGPEAEGQVSGLMRLATVLAVLLPVALIWMAVGLASAIAGLRAEAAELRLRLGQMREAAARGGVALPAAAPVQTPRGNPQPAQPRAASAPTPARASAPVSDGRQTAMRFDAPASVAVDSDDLIRALNFPEGPDDVETIAALRAALKDHETSRIIRSAQDVVTLLSENGLYMDSLSPDAPRPDLWRRFAEGMRGDAVQDMAGIHDEDALALTVAMLKGDEIFRDTAHHFLRHFDLMLTRIGGHLDDTQLRRLADTRSARAFMLLGRAANVFA